MEKTRRVALAAAFAVWTVGTAFGEIQTWNDVGSDNVWSTNSANWDAGSVWTNGNSAVFAGAGGTIAGETVELSATVMVANVTFQTNGYVIADTDGDGNFSIAGGPAVIAVPNSNGTAVISTPIGGSGGLTKTGPGVLQLSGTNTYAGVTTVSAGTLKLAFNMPAALGAEGTGNDTVVSNGATLDFNGCFCAVVYVTYLSRNEDITVAGSGVNGQGALINSGAGIINTGLRNLTLAGDTVIGGSSRLDLGGTGNYYGNGYTLTKTGSCEMAISRPITNSAIIISAGTYIVQTPTAFGGNDYATTLNGGIINLYVKDMSFTEHFYLNGGRFRRTGQVGTNTVNGVLTLGGWTSIEAPDNVTNTLFLTGVLEGTGGVSFASSGPIYVTGTSNTYSGATANSGVLCLGRPNLYAGSLGLGAVTNNGTVYCYSSRLGPGDFVNKNQLYFDATNSFAISNNLLGTGTDYIRYGGQMTLDGNTSTSATFRVANGGLTLTNGASLYTAAFLLADRTSNVNYPVDPTNVTGVLTIMPGTSLTMSYLEVGDGNAVAGGCMTGIVNQWGGTVRTYGWSGDPTHFPGEYDGLHFGHYAQANDTYNMMGGTLTIDNGYRLTIAVDGTGVLHQTGGQIYSQSVVVNTRDANPGGYGRLTLEGGAMNVGSNGISAGVGAAYLVQYGGAGGILRATTNFASSLNATLFGSNENAITFDTTNWTIELSGNLTGTGGLNKTGTGDLVLSGTNTYGGPTRIYAGTISPSGGSALSTNSVIAFGVAADGSGGILKLPDGFSLANNTVGVANPESLDKKQSYTVLSWSGGLSAPFGASALPGAWYVYYDWENKTAQLRAAVGTVIKLR